MEPEADNTAEKQVPRSLDELLAEGKRCLAAGDVASAVESFQNACSLLADQFGQLSKELAEPYYLYGKALLECARMESTVLGSGIPGPNTIPTPCILIQTASVCQVKVPEDKCSSDEEEEEEEEDEGSKEGEGEGEETATDATSSGPHLEPNTTAPQPSVPAVNTETSGVCEGKGEKEEDRAERRAGKGSNGSMEAGPSGATEETAEGAVEGTGKGEGEEEETDLKLAWEVLELARVICQREDTDEYKLKLSDVYFSLGEVALESDQIDQAVQDMNSGLQLKEILLEPHDRRLAEAHFNLGLAYSLQKDHQRSIQEYKCARNTLIKRKEKLEGELKDKEGSERRECEEELNDLNSLLPELDSKIADAEESKTSEEEKVTFGDSSSSNSAETAATSSAESKAPINDISHLLRKRPADSAVGGKDSKRIRTEQLPPSSTTSNGTTGPELTAEQ